MNNIEKIKAGELCTPREYLEVITHPDVDDEILQTIANLCSDMENPLMFDYRNWIYLKLLQYSNELMRVLFMEKNPFLPFIEQPEIRINHDYINEYMHLAFPREDLSLWNREILMKKPISSYEERFWVDYYNPTTNVLGSSSLKEVTKINLLAKHMNDNFMTMSNEDVKKSYEDINNLVYGL